MLRIVGAGRHLEAAGIAASTTRTHLPGEKADQPQLGPLAGPKGPRQLLPGVQTVPDGIYEIVSKQQEHWGYIKVMH